MKAAAAVSLWLGSTDDPVRESTVGSILRAAAAQSGSTLAVVAWGANPGERRAWTYAELLRDAERTARALLAHFEPGEHIAVFAQNSAEWLLLELGAGLAGLVLVTVNPAYRAKELEYVLRQSRSTGVFYTRQFRGNTYRIEVKNPDGVSKGVKRLRLDGREIDPKAPIPFVEDGKAHAVEVVLG